MEEAGSQKIKEAIRFIRKELFEVPFMAFYRKESIEGLTLRDLWRVLHRSRRVSPSMDSLR